MPRLRNGLRPSPKLRRPLWLQPLEDRTVPTTFLVTNLNDGSPAPAGSLRAAINSAHNNPGSDTINFSVGGAINLSAGALHVDDAVAIAGSVTINAQGASRVFDTSGAPAGTQITFAGLTIMNGLSPGDGGGIFIGDESVTVVSCIITGNTAGGGLGDGGGIAVDTSPGSLTLTGSIVSGNHSTDKGGGGISGGSTAVATITACSIVNNTAATEGGGIAFSGTLTLVSSTLAGNTAPTGAGLEFHGTSSSIIRNCTFSGNTATGAGGGIGMASSNTLNLQNSTITANTAAGSGGGGIARTGGIGSIVLESCIVSGNTDTAGSNEDLFTGGKVYAKYCAIGTTTGVTTFMPDTTTKYMVGANLFLGTLSSNGGSTQTHLPATNSPVRDKGSNPGGLTTDQRGIQRTLNTVPDIGAVEVVNLVVRNNSDSGKDSLRQQVLDANAVAGANTITFDSVVFNTAQTIKLTSGEILVSESINVAGMGQSLVTISGNNNDRVFQLNATGTPTFTFSDLTVSGGKSSSLGGGFFVSAGIVTLTRCVVSNNTANNNGGAIDMLGNNASLTLTDCTVANNSAPGTGGGIEMGGFTQTLVVSGCTFSGNSAGTKGGGINFANTGSVTIRNSTFSGNFASQTGGGINIHGAATITVQNSTFSANVADTSAGGGICREVAGTLQIDSSIVFGNSGAVAPDINTPGTATVTVSLVGSKSGVSTFNGDAFTIAHLGANPLLGPLANNGGLTQTRLPGAGSPAIDNGSNLAALTTDQRGASFPRVVNIVADIGAVETTDLVVRNINDAGKDSLRQRVLDANAIGGADSITFDPTVFATSQTIKLSSASGEIAINQAVTITGPAAKVTISGGGAIRIFNTSGAGMLAPIILQGLALTNGKSTGDGGAIFAQDEALTLQMCSINNCIASFDGGAVSMLSFSVGGSLTIEDSTLSGNISNNTVSTEGGGAVYFRGGASKLLISNSTLSGNSASMGGCGGAICLRFFNGSVVIQNSTIAGNSSTVSGGGIASNFAQGTITVAINSTIVAGNSNASAPDIFFNPAFSISADHSLVGVADAGNFTLTGSNNQTGTKTTPLNALLFPLADNGGPTQTQLPRANSPVVDKGSNPASLPTDQRGGLRQAGVAVDIGAVERQAAATFVVDITADENDGNFSKGDLSLREAVALANQFPESVDTVSFDPAVFGSFKTINLSLGEIVINSPANISGPGASLLTLDGQDAFRIFRIVLSDDGTETCTITGVKLVNGKADKGGAVYVRNYCALQMTNCTISGNFATSYGGGIYAHNTSEVVLTNCTLSGNVSQSLGGAAFVSSTDVTLQSCLVTGNTAPFGGGLYGEQTDLLLENSTVSNNHAIGSSGAGGGVCLDGFGALTIHNSTISGNSSASRGGGIFFVGGGDATFILQNSTVSGNTASGNGGGIYFVGSNYYGLTIQNSTITANESTSGKGGGIYQYGGPLTLASTIVSGNTNATAPDIFCYYFTPITADHVLVGVADVGNFSLIGSSQTGSKANPLNAKLGSLQNNGGPTMTHVPAADSPVINQGSNPAALPTDQRGLPRQVGAAVDIGAVERQPGASYIVDIAIDENDGNFSKGDLSLREAVLLTNASAESNDTVSFDPAVFNSATTMTLTLGEIAINGSVTITGALAKLTLDANSASRIFNSISTVASSTVTISGLTLVNGKTTTTGADGGAIQFGVAVATLNNVVLTGNTAADGDGGAISVAGGGNLTIADCTISNNSALRTGSSSAGGQGGGINLDSSASLTVLRSTISGNSANEDGGGVYFFNSGSLTVTESTISNNTSNTTFAGPGGGGIYFWGAVSAGGFTITNSTISGNKSNAGSGGGIVLSSFNGNAVIQNSTITGNSASASGGGIARTSGSGTVTLASTIVAGNSNATAPDIYFNSAVTLSADHCLVGVADAGNFTLPSGNLSGTKAVPLNAKLGALANNGGPTQTQLPAADSPVIGQGANPQSLPNDQRGSGFARVVGAQADIGAVEVQNILPLLVFNNNDSGVGSLRQTIADASVIPGANTITFDPTFFSAPRTITLGAELAISDALTITGPGPTLATVSGKNASRIFNTSKASAMTSVNITGLTLTGGSQSSGGAIIASGEALILSNCVLTGNKATSFGEAVSTTGGTLTAIDCTFSNNSGGTTGALDLIAGTKTILIRCTVSGNTSVSGGGIYSRGYLLLDSSTVSGNTATGGQGGGGIDVFGPNYTIVVRNSTISGNSASGSSGGGILINGAGGTLTVQNSTITNNSAATQGGGIAAPTATPPTITVESSIIAKNINGSAPDILSSGTVNVNFSAVESNAGFTLSASSGNNLPFGTDLKLDALANNGGPTQTHLPAPNSPVVNNGSNPVGFDNDQRGPSFARKIGGGVDIGAVEVESLIVTNANDAGTGSLRQVVLDANAKAGANLIEFDPAFFATASTITLTSGEIPITDAVTISGPAAKVTVDAKASSRILNTSGAAPGASINAIGLSFTGGNNSSGGAIFIGDEAVTLFNCSITGNKASNQGGGLWADKAAAVVICDCTLSGNTAGVAGGAVAFNLYGGSLVVEGSTLSGNTAGAIGGAIHDVMSTITDGLTLRNSTVSGNTAGQSGGGISFGSFGASTLLIQNSTLTLNKATTGSGGGISQTSGPTPMSITIESSILSGNTSSQAGHDIRANDPVSVNFSAIGDSNGFAITGANNLAFGTDLKLGPLASNGGPTQTHALLAGSPCIDKGSNPAMLANDQRRAGFSRVFNGAADIGAYEMQAVPPCVAGNTVIINGGGAQRSRVSTIAVPFDQVVTLPMNTADAFELKRQSDSALVGLTANADNSTGKSVVTLTFNGTVSDFGSLADGRYTLTIFASKVSSGGGPLDGDCNGVGGDDFILVGSPANGLFRLFGDADGNGTVNSTDFATFRSFFGLGSSIFDFNNDGQTNSNDFAEFRKRFGITLVP